PDDCVIPTKDVPNGEETRNDGKAADSRAITNSLSLSPLRHDRLTTPIVLEPPRTWVPGLTVTSAPAGNNTSTREPNRIRPINSPFSTESPTFFQHTMRRAITPAICVKTNFTSS